MFPPFTVTVSAGLPAGAESADTVMLLGSGTPPEGVERAKGNEFEVPSEFDALTTAVPGNAACGAVIGAVT